MSTWVKRKLGDVINLNLRSIKKDFSYDKIEYIDISSVGTGKLESVVSISLADAPSRAKRLVENGDTILATVRPNRRSFLYIKNPPKNRIVSTGFAVLTPSNIDSRFLYYLVSQQEFTDYLSSNAKGAAYPAVDEDIINRVDVLVPDLPTQTHIASVLSAYDDLIENNEKRIKILEEMAERLYREWFVKFKFPGHEKVRLIDSGTEYGKIPEGWGMKQIKDLYETSSGGTPSRENANEVDFYSNATIPWVKTKELEDNYILDTEEKITELAIKKSSAKIFPKNTVLIAMYGATIGKLGILSQLAATNQACCAFLLKDTVYSSYYIFQFLKNNTKKITSLAFGAAQPNISQNTIRNIDILKPSMSILQLYNRNVDVIFNEILLLQRNNKILFKIRDLLIPQLVAGKRELR